MATFRRKPFVLAFSSYLAVSSFSSLLRGKQRRPDFIRERTNTLEIVCSLSLSFVSFFLFFFLFFFWSEGLFRTGTLGDYLMEVEHVGMSGIGESHGGWHRERGVERRRERRGGRVDEEEGLGTTDVPGPPSA